ncbi:DUF4349 domain-containing protein [Streptomyces sannanensis]
MRAVRTSRRGPRTALAAVLLTATLAIAGCGANDVGSEKSLTDGSAADSKGGSGAHGAPPAGERQAPQPGDGAARAQKPVKVAPQLIRTAEISVQVDDASKALAKARTVALSAGGFVGNESTERDDEGHVASTVVLRVPQDQYDSVLAKLSGTGKLLSRSSEAKDVTDQVVDVDSRVRTQRASVARVQEMMGRATKLSDVVTLEGELSRRQAELEALLAQQASLKDRTGMATISLALSETEPLAEETEGDPGFLDALGGGWDAFLTTVKWIAVVLGAVLPFAAALALLFALWRLLVRPRLPKRTAPVPAQANPGNPGLPRYVPTEEEQD